MLQHGFRAASGFGLCVDLTQGAAHAVVLAGDTVPVVGQNSVDMRTAVFLQRAGGCAVRRREDDAGDDFRPDVHPCVQAAHKGFNAHLFSLGELVLRGGFRVDGNKAAFGILRQLPGEVGQGLLPVPEQSPGQFLWLLLLPEQSYPLPSLLSSQCRHYFLIVSHIFYIIHLHIPTNLSHKARQCLSRPHLYKGVHPICNHPLYRLLPTHT